MSKFYRKIAIILCITLIMGLLMIGCKGDATPTPEPDTGETGTTGETATDTTETVVEDTTTESITVTVEMVEKGFTLAGETGETDLDKYGNSLVGGFVICQASLAIFNVALDNVSTEGAAKLEDFSNAAEMTKKIIGEIRTKTEGLTAPEDFGEEFTAKTLNHYTTHMEAIDFAVTALTPGDGEELTEEKQKEAVDYFNKALEEAKTARTELITVLEEKGYTAEMGVAFEEALIGDLGMTSVENIRIFTQGASTDTSVDEGTGEGTEATEGNTEGATPEENPEEGDGGH